MWDRICFFLHEFAEIKLEAVVLFFLLLTSAVFREIALRSEICAAQIRFYSNWKTAPTIRTRIWFLFLVIYLAIVHHTCSESILDFYIWYCWQLYVVWPTNKSTQTLVIRHLIRPFQTFWSRGLPLIRPFLSLVMLQEEGSRGPRRKSSFRTITFSLDF